MQEDPNKKKTKYGDVLVNSHYINAAPLSLSSFTDGICTSAHFRVGYSIPVIDSILLYFIKKIKLIIYFTVFAMGNKKIKWH